MQPICTIRFRPARAGFGFATYSNNDSNPAFDQNINAATKYAQSRIHASWRTSRPFGGEIRINRKSQVFSWRFWPLEENSKSYI